LRRSREKRFIIRYDTIFYLRSLGVLPVLLNHVVHVRRKVKVSERKAVQSDELESFIKSTPEIGKGIRRVVIGAEIKLAIIKISA
jgi:hypothetical protein